MSDFLFFVIASVGMTLILVRGDIFKEVRNWITSFAPKLPTQVEVQQIAGQDVPVQPTLPLTTFQYLCQKIIMAIHCCQCTGFWCGALCGIWYVYFTSDTVNIVDGLPKLFLCGCIGSVCSLTADILLEYFHIYIHTHSPR
jgi:hypothetical protein